MLSGGRSTLFNVMEERVRERDEVAAGIGHRKGGLPRRRRLDLSITFSSTSFQDELGALDLVLSDLHWRPPYGRFLPRCSEARN